MIIPQSVDFAKVKQVPDGSKCRAIQLTAGGITMLE